MEHRSYDHRRHPHDDDNDEKARDTRSRRVVVPDDARRPAERDRSRSRSPKQQHPDGRKAQHEQARRDRMARLRAENEHEEYERAVAQEKSKQHQQDNYLNNGSAGPQDAIVAVNPEELEGLDENEQMMKLLGFGANGEFGSTKGQKVIDNHRGAAQGAASKHKARKYRQYMNRKNGFNRPLDKMD